MKKVRFIPISMLALLMASCNFSTNGEALPSHPSNTRPSKPSDPTALPSTSVTKSTSGVTKTLVSSPMVSSGNHTITVGSNEYSTTLILSTKGCVVYSDQGSASLE